MVQPKRTMNGSCQQESFSSRPYFFTFSFHTMSVQPVRRMVSECHTRILNVFTRRQQVCVLELYFDTKHRLLTHQLHFVILVVVLVIVVLVVVCVMYRQFFSPLILGSS